MADTIRSWEFAPGPAAWPSGKAEDCKSFIPSSNLGAASFLGNYMTQISLREFCYGNHLGQLL
jgi:hypothetical protein